MPVAPRANPARLAIGLALAVALASCSSGGEDPDLDFHRGRNGLWLERYDWARFYFAEDLKHHPDRIESLRGMGTGWISGFEGSLSKAIDAFESYLERAPDDHEIRASLARAWLLSGESGLALEALESLPAGPESDLLKATAWLDRHPASARDHVESALRSEPDRFQTQHLAARVYERLNDDARAAAHAERALGLDPLQGKVHYLLSQVYRRLGKAEKSRRSLETFELLRRLPSPRSPIKVSSSEELRLMRRLAARLPATAVPFRGRLCRVLFEAGRTDEAVAVLRQLAADPTVALGILMDLGQLAERHGRGGIAADLYLQVADREPNHRGAVFRRVELAGKSGDYDGARRILDPALAAEPFYAPFHYAAGRLEMAAPDGQQRALTALATAVDLAPWMAQYRIALADLLLAAGRRDEFERLLAAAPAADAALDAYRQRHAG